ncbi:hypothetical protein FACS189443_1480 [Planctomycetales bacterium]|nr:hypothetical protein FACS189443_1480 [Planctomycetales bacterium]
MSEKTAIQSVEFLIEQSRDSEWVELIFIGGEPLLEFGLIRSVIQYAGNHSARKKKNKRIGFTLTTNGTLLSDEMLAFFQENDCRFLLSVDAVGADNDRCRRMKNGQSQYEILCGKMPILKTYQPWQGARVTVLPETARRLAENLQNLHRELNINQFIVGFATGLDWTDEQIADYCFALKEVFEFLLRERIDNKNPRLRIGLMEVGLIDEAYAASVSTAWGCGAGNGRIAVAPDGTLYGCTKLAFAAKDNTKKYALGDVFNGFTEIQNRLTLLNHTESVRPKCKNCFLARRCNGGCYAANLTDTDNIFCPSDTYCKLIYAQMTAADYARNRLKEIGLKNVYWHSETQNADTSQVP